jgi:hypothetical protein
MKQREHFYGEGLGTAGAARGAEDPSELFTRQPEGSEPITGHASKDVVTLRRGHVQGRYVFMHVVVQ